VNEWFDHHAIDLLAWTKERFESPNGYSLKAIAPLCGFNWRDDDPGGLQSEIWYEEMLTGADEMMQRLLEYNEDDVAAQKAIRGWIVANDSGSGPGTAIPSVLTWPVA
jgi:predicted RecB family nuclease